MDFTKAVTINSLNLNSATSATAGAPKSGYLLDRYTEEPAAAVGYLEKRPLSDGFDAGDVYLNGRTVRLVVTAYGSTSGDFWDKVQSLRTALSPTLQYTADSANVGFLAFDYYQPTADVTTWPTSAYPDGIPLRQYLRAVSGPSYSLDRDKDGGLSAKGRSNRFDATLVARDPRRFHQTQITATLATSTSTAVYKGNYPSPAIVTFSLTAAGSSVFTIVVDGYSNVLNLSTASNSVLPGVSYTYDYDKRTLVLTDSGTSQAAFITSAGGYPQIQSGSTFRIINTTGIRASNIRYREAFS